MKLCTSCMHYEAKINYCNIFKFKTNSISSASICCKYTEFEEVKESPKEPTLNSTQADSLIKNSNKSKRNKKDLTDVVKCSQCSKLFFNTFCSSLNKNILNPNKPIRCDLYIKK